ncbi:MAG: peptide deformylase [Epulopiscium sp. Nele67-Bin005]|nr:MAG: peptide deformylase [Epulopiscium sp. Nele67-Bin005]
MAIRKIRTDDDEILRKVSKPVRNFDTALHELLDDMAETMYDAEGVGLAAPQIGLLKRIFVIDIGEGITEFINPEIVETSGEQVGDEGCLSVPAKYGLVTRPHTVKIKALDRHGVSFEISGEEFMARAMCHEFDHLEGKLFVDFIEGDLFDVPPEE